MRILQRIKAFLTGDRAPLPMGWANANRIEAEHRRHVAALEVQGIDAFEASQEERAAAEAFFGEDDDSDPPCPNPGGHEWYFTGAAYGGDDESYHGEGRVYCTHCGADGDA